MRGTSSASLDPHSPLLYPPSGKQYTLPIPHLQLQYKGVSMKGFYLFLYSIALKTLSLSLILN